VVSVAVVEDSAAVRELWRQMLTSITGVSVVAEFSQAKAAIEGICADPPDIVLLDIALAEGNGMDVLKALVPACPATQVIVVTNYAEPIYRKQYMGAGAHAFYDKNRDLRALREALAGLAASRPVITECTQ